MKQTSLRTALLTAALGAAAWIGGQSAQAGVFNIPHFVTPGEYAIGFEPELTLTNGSGLAADAKYTHGLSELTNAQAILGTGGGPRRFRVGGGMTFDFFPDISGQPGIGLGTQLIYVRLHDNAESKDSGQLEMTAIPYIHKTFINGTNEVEPFFSLPFGFGFADGHYQALATAVVGAMFKNSEKFRYVMEIGIAVNHTESYLSGGFVYYH